MKFCQNSFEAFDFYFSFRLSKSANFVKDFATNPEFCHIFRHSKSSAFYDV